MRVGSVQRFFPYVDVVTFTLYTLIYIYNLRYTHKECFVMSAVYNSNSTPLELVN